MTTKIVVSRRHALRLFGGAALTISCGEVVDQPGNVAGDGGADHPPGVLDFGTILQFPDLSIAMSADSIFACDGVSADSTGTGDAAGAIVAISRSGAKAPSTLVPGQSGPAHICWNGQELFWTNTTLTRSSDGDSFSSSFEKVQLGGAPPASLVSAPTRVDALVVDGSSIAYILEAAAGDGEVVVLQDGGMPIKLGTSPAAVLFLKDGWVYWVQRNAGAEGAAVMKARGDGTETQMVLGISSALASTVSLIDDRAIYVTSDTPQVMFYDGRVTSLGPIGRPLAVRGSEVVLEAYGASASGLTIVDVNASTSRALFPIQSSVVAVAFDDVGIAWLEAKDASQHDGSPRLLYYPFGG